MTFVMILMLYTCILEEQILSLNAPYYLALFMGGCGHDCMVVGFTTTCAICVYHH